MNGPYRNPLESRSSRVPARQYVSETHDHKPDVDMFYKIKWLSGEFMAQAGRFRDSAVILESARADRSLEGIRAALSTLQHFHDQTTLLIGSLSTALQNHDKGI